MRHDDSEPTGPRVEAPTLSLLRLSALERLVGAAALLVVLWAAVLATIA